MPRNFLAFLCSAVLAFTTPASALELSEAELKQLVLQTIRDNPEIVVEAIGILQAREDEAQQAAASAALKQNGGALLNDPNAPVIGNPDGDVTVVEFFDYNCPYCRRASVAVNAMLADDPNVRVVMREWPILGDESVFASKAALASRTQGKYAEFHDGLMEIRGRVTEQTVIDLAATLDLDIDQLRKDMDAPEVLAHIQLSQHLSQSLGITGTPAFVFGETLVPGFIELAGMKELLLETRSSRE